MTSTGARIVLLGVSLLFALGVGEIGLRLYSRTLPQGLGPTELRIRYLQPSAIPGLGFVNRPGFRYEGNEDHNRGVEVAFNRLGFRGSEADADALEAGRGDDTLLIAVLGDSYTLGSSVPLEATFTKVTEARLRAAGYRARAVNLGTGSYNSQQEAAFLEHRLFAQGHIPDILVWQFLLNDVWEAAHFRAYAERPSALERRSLVAWLLGSTIRRARADETDWRVRMPRDYAGIRDLMLRLYADPRRVGFIEDSLTRARSVLADHEVEGVFLYIPYHEMFESWRDYQEPQRDLDAQVLEMAARAGWPAPVSTVAAEMDHPFLDLILDVERDHHPNVLGHRIIATVLSQEIERRLAEDPDRYTRFRVDPPVNAASAP